MIIFYSDIDYYTITVFRRKQMQDLKKRKYNKISKVFFRKGTPFAEPTISKVFSRQYKLVFWSKYY